jgi:hypothetical protein
MSFSGKVFTKMQRTVAAATAGVLLLALAIAFRQQMESSMALHMLLQIPLLLCAGALIASTLAAASRERHVLAWLAGHWRSHDENGVTGLVALTVASAYWMIPKALDHVLASPTADFWKIVSLLAIGAMLPGAFARANRIIQLFFLGNLVSMMAIAGMLYQDAPQRLCNSYLMDDQVVAGTGLVVFAIAIALAWVAHQITFAHRSHAAAMLES